MEKLLATIEHWIDVKIRLHEAIDNKEVLELVEERDRLRENIKNKLNNL